RAASGLRMILIRVSCRLAIPIEGPLYLGMRGSASLRCNTRFHRELAISCFTRPSPADRGNG
ncbi:MAG: hypothetical protein AB1609_17600, partial [Bacillota bacterium]